MPPGGVVLGEPVGGGDVGKHLGAEFAAGRLERVPRVPDDLADRVALLAVQRVGERGLLRLVVRGQRAVHQAGRGEQPALAVGLQDERVDPGDRRHAGGVRVGPVGRSPVGDEVGHVVPGPLALVRVPPDQRLALAPRLAVGVGRGAVVQDPPVGRPGPAPLRRHPALLGSRLAPRRLVHAVGPDPAVDPAAAGGRSVVLELRVGGQRLPVGVPAVDLGQHGLGRRLGQRPLHRVVPGEVLYRPVHLVGRSGQLLPDPAAEVVGEPQVAAHVPGRLDRLVVPLQHPLGVGERAVLLGVRGGGQEEHLGADVLACASPRSRSPGRSARRWRSRS